MDSEFRQFSVVMFHFQGVLDFIHRSPVSEVARSFFCVLDHGRRIGECRDDDVTQQIELAALVHSAAASTGRAADAIVTAHRVPVTASLVVGLVAAGVAGGT